MGQTLGNVVLAGALLVLAVVPMIFITHSVYKDGAFGRFALACICAASALAFLEIVFFGNNERTVHGLLILDVFGFSVFLCWHLWRFHSRVLSKSTEERVHKPVVYKLG